MTIIIFAVLGMGLAMACYRMCRAIDGGSL